MSAVDAALELGVRRAIRVLKAGGTASDAEVCLTVALAVAERIDEAW